MSEPAPSRRHVAATLGHAALGVALATFPGFWPFAGRQLSHMVTRALQVFGEASTGPRRTSVGMTTMAIVGSGAVVTAVLAGGVLYRLQPSHSLDLALVAGSAALAGAMLSPLLLVPVVMAHHGQSLFGAMHAAWVLGARLGFLRLSFLGGFVGLLLACAALLPTRLLGDVGFLVVIPAFGLATGLAALAVVRAYVQVHEGALPELGGDPLRRPLLLLLPTALCLGGATLTAAVTPTRVHLDAPPGMRSVTTPVHDSLDLGGPAGLVVDANEYSVRVADGGGAGRLQAPHFGYWQLRAGRTSYQGREAVAVVMVDDTERAFVTYVDDDGVRLDDGLVERIGSRLGSNGVGLLALALTFFGIGAWRVLRRRADARLLTLEAHSPAGGDAGALALEGTLRLGSDAGLRVEGSRLHVVGDAWLVGLGGEPRVRLPQGPLELLGEPPERPPSEGQSACIVGNFESLRGLDYRGGASPWPGDGRLLLGSRGAALAHLSDDAARSAAPFLWLSWVCLGLGALVLSFGG